MDNLCIYPRVLTHTAESGLQFFDPRVPCRRPSLKKRTSWTVPQYLARMSHEHCAKVETQPPPAALRTETFRKARPSIVGGEIPEPPYPIILSGAVQHGFGRGGRDLGCHTGMYSASVMRLWAYGPRIDYHWHRCSIDVVLSQQRIFRRIS